MNLKTLLLSVAAGAFMVACSDVANDGLGRITRSDASYDQGNLQPAHTLAEMIAGIWVDGNGCEHWIIDDGIEGYMSTRWGADGKPYCPAGNVAYTTKGFKRTQWFSSSTRSYGYRNVPGAYTTVPGASRIQTGSAAPSNVAGPIPFQNYDGAATISETNVASPF